MLKNLELGLAEREAMIRILQSNKTMSNSNLAAEIVNKAASGVAVGAPATSGVQGVSNASDTIASLRNMLNSTPSNSLQMTNHNLPQHHYQMSLVGSPSSSSTTILHNKALSHLAAEPRPYLQTSTPSFSSGALLLPAAPPPPAPSSAATLQSMLSPALHHSKQLSTPITIASGNTFKSISLHSTPTRNIGAFVPTQPSAHSFLHQLHGVHQQPNNPLLAGRSMTPSADMLFLRSAATPIGHPTSDIVRSMTPGPSDLHRPHAMSSISGMTNQLDQLTLKTAALRRESAPAGVYLPTNPASHPMVSVGSHSGAK